MSSADESRPPVPAPAFPGLEWAPIAFYVSGVDGRLYEANEAFLQTFGYPSVEAVNAAGGTWALYREEAGRRRFVEAVTSAGEVQSFEVALVNRAGEERTALIHGRLVDGRMVGAVMDITERKADERALERRNRDLAALYAVDMAVAGRRDAEAFVGAALDAAMDALGADRGVVHLVEPPGGELVLAAHRGLPDALATVLSRLRPEESLVARFLHERRVTVLSAGDYPEGAPMKRFIAPDDVLVAAPLLSTDGPLGSLVLGRPGGGAFPDDDLALLGSIGRRLGAAVANARLYRSLERQLEETAWLHREREAQAAYLARIIDALGHPFHVIDVADMTLRLVNEASRRMGVQVGATCHAALHGRDTPCDDVDHPCPVGAIQRTGRPQVVEHVRPDAKDGRRVVEVHAHPIYDDAGTLKQVIEYAFDATDRKQLEVDLARTDRLVAIGTLAAGVVHEINTPLAYAYANIGAAVEENGRLLEAPDGPSRGELGELGELLTDARQGVKRVVEIVRSIKSFARVEEEAGTTVDLLEALDLAADVARHEYKYRARLVRSYAPVPDVAGSVGRLSQVFLNLIVNAAHAIEEGRPEANEIRLRAFPEGDDAVVEVEDTGCGIEAARLNRIFEPFFTTKPRGVGTGLGLAICRDLVEGLGGRIEVESRVGEGSTFRVRLRAALVKAHEGEEDAAPGTAPWSGSASQASPSQLS